MVWLDLRLSGTGFLAIHKVSHVLTRTLANELHAPSCGRGYNNHLWHSCEHGLCAIWLHHTCELLHGLIVVVHIGVQLPIHLRIHLAKLLVPVAAVVELR